MASRQEKIKSPSTCYVLTGTDSSLKQSFTLDVRQSLKLDARHAVDVLAIDANQQGAVAQALNELRTASFFGGSKMVVLHNADVCDKPEKELLIGYLERAVRENCLILDVNRLSRRDRLFNSVPKENVIHCDVETHDTQAWIRRYVQKQGRTIAPTAIQVLLNGEKPSLTSLGNSLDLLMNFVDAKEDIRVEHIRQVLVRVSRDEPFALTRAIESKEAGQAMRIIREMMASGRGGLELIGLLAWHFRRVWTVKSLSQNTQNLQDLSKQVGIPLRFLKGFQQMACDLSHQRLKSIFDLLLRTDLALKSSVQDEQTTMQLLAYQLCTHAI